MGTVFIFDPVEKAPGFAEEHGPKPSEVYGFVGAITTVIATVIFSVWAYTPEPWLHYLGITYYPSKTGHRLNRSTKAYASRMETMLLHLVVFLFKKNDRTPRACRAITMAPARDRLTFASSLLALLILRLLATDAAAGLHWARKRSCCSFSFLTYLLPGPIAYAASSCSLRPPAPAWSSRTNSLATGNLSSGPSIPIGSPSSGSIGWIFINVLEGPILEQVLHQPALDRDALSGVRLNHGYWEHRQSMSCLPTATSVIRLKQIPGADPNYKDICFSNAGR
uniref:Uncharacterized protein LOC105043892 n=1 Tax=Elaeis guineensis var. tenera TaxID=51953 RepID=A0A8N4EVW8_ELAGV|nr:uncharacterized protein LOC105043892 [Elaeis guineensis]